MNNRLGEGSNYYSNEYHNGGVYFAMGFHAMDKQWENNNEAS